MYCNFCGKNFDRTEGFEEVNHAGHHMVRCDKCVYNNAEEEFDWHREMYGRGSRSHRTGSAGISLRRKP